MLLKIIGCYPVYGLVDNDFAPSDNINEFLRIMEAKLKYITAYLNEGEYSLYKLTCRQRDYFVQQGYLPMRLGLFDVAAREKYKILATKIYG